MQGLCSFLGSQRAFGVAPLAGHVSRHAFSLPRRISASGVWLTRPRRGGWRAEKRKPMASAILGGPRRAPLGAPHAHQQRSVSACSFAAI